MDSIIGLLPDSIRKIPVHMDYEGQKKAERTFQVIIVLFAIVGFLWGYACQQFSQTVYILGAGFALSCIITLPPWPMYRSNPIQWQKPRPKIDDTAKNTSSPQQAVKPKKKK
ncbi:unnamed protein product [Owenia fusiformis]|uniref:Signal peptidase complex subunit 1 n=1 Tax=Owenia fusiformis TaxID=6347 RepID=A0A8J1UAZ7_OWEFU|nr:unnamed protein product [Owenia fusiformis]